MINKIKEILNNVGDKIGEVFNSKISEVLLKVGIEQTNLTVKLITILILLVLAYFSLKITKQILKFGILVVLVLLIVSIVTSLF